VICSALLHVRHVTIGSVLVVALGCGAAARAQDTPPVSCPAAVAQESDAAPDEAIFKLRTGPLPTFRGGATVKLLATVEDGNIYLVRGQRTQDLIAQLREEPERIPYAQPNFIIRVQSVPNDTHFGKLWGLRNTGQPVGTNNTPGLPGADVRAEPAWTVTTPGPTIVVGVLDSGVDSAHSDLAKNLWPNPGGFGNAGCLKGTHGYDFDANTCYPTDRSGHGTHVAGTIGAIGHNGFAVTGASWKTTTELMILKVLTGDDTGLVDRAIAAINFAIDAKVAGANVRVLSNSWSTPNYSCPLYDVIKKANDKDILFVAAAGNANNTPYGVDIDTTPTYPASFKVPNIIAVAATDNNDELWKKSNFGLNSVHLGAPGVEIYSTAKGGGCQYKEGTSMATPHVSGAAAVILSSGSYDTASLKNLIIGSVDPLTSLKGKTITGGRLNICKALPKCKDFSLSVEPLSASVPREGGSAMYSISLTRTGGFDRKVKLTVTGLPSGVSTRFEPKCLGSTATKSVLTLTVAPKTASGMHRFMITAKGGHPQFKRAARAALDKSP
jgi:large repetitive protein